MKRTLFLCLIVLSGSCFAQEVPRIGLTLSGGGAKGLAHIGILQAIDSAGLRVDYLTGTSMGSIMGSLYAAGYSGKDIEKIIRKLDWNALFSGRPSLRNVNIDEKTEVDNYAIELPVEDRKIKFYSGIIEGQELWLKLQELFLPMYDVKDFSKFSIPFKCIATDVSTGKAVVLDSGEVVSAIRSSMAIPSVFTAIDYNDTKLVDGGLVRNFPVKDVRDMGANYVIGVNLSQGLQPAKDLHTAVDVLYQIGFYKDADDFENQRALCDVYIEPPVRDFSAASFGSADSLIKIGKKVGDEFYPVFKKLADSLKSIDPTYTTVKARLPKTNYIIVDSIAIRGLRRTTKTSFLNRLNLEAGQAYNGNDVAEAVRKVFGSQNYKRVAYHWQPATPGHAQLIFDVIENPLTYLKAGIHYHTFSNVALIAAIESKNLLFDRSKTTAKLNLSENIRVLLEHNQTFGRADNNNLIVSFNHERLPFPIYQDFRQTFLYRSAFSKFDIRLQHNFKFHSAFGIGSSFEDFSLKPKISDSEFKSGNNYLDSYLYYVRNTLNQKYFATEGMRIYAKVGHVYLQKPDDDIFDFDPKTATGDSVTFDNYQQIRLKVEHFKPINPRVTLLTQFNFGANLNYDGAYLNFYGVGGINDFLRNQITFIGLNEYQVNTNSIGTLMLGFQYEPVKNFYGIARANIGIYDFAGKETSTLNKQNFLSGYGLTAGYDSGIGPITISIMYSDQVDRLFGYVNIGFHF